MILIHCSLHLFLFISLFGYAITQELVPKFSDLSRCSKTVSHEVSNTRFLRSDEEERMQGASWLDQINLYLSRKVPDSIIEQWHKNGESHQSAFELMGLTKAKSQLFDNARFHQWIDYVKVKRDDIRDETILTLSKHFNNDAQLYKIIDEAKGRQEFAALATKLQADLLDYWATEIYKEPKEVFHLLELNTHMNTNSMLENPKFLEWLTYVDKYGAHHSDAEKLAIMTLTSHFQLDFQPYKILEKTKMVRGYEDLSARLQAALMDQWATNGKEPEKIWYVLGLPMQMDRRDLFHNPKFHEWVAYVDNLNAKHPKTPISMIPTLTRHLESSDLLDLIDIAKKDDKSSSKLAEKIESELYEKLIEGPIADDVLNKIGLSQPHRLQDKRYLLRLKRLIDEYSVKDPRNEEKIYHTLASKYHARDVVACISSLKKSTSGMEMIGEKLESVLRDLWLTKGETVVDVFLILKVSKRVQNINVWLSYCNWIIEKTPREISTFIAFLERFSGVRRGFMILEAAKKFPNLKEVATAMQTKEVQHVFERMVDPPRTVFKLFGLADDKNVLGNSLFPKWLKYLKNYNQENPKHELFWGTPLLATFGITRVLNMITEAKQSADTVEIAKMVESGLQQLWSGINNKRLLLDFSSAHLHKTKEATLATPAFSKWAKILDNFNRLYPEHKIRMIDILLEFYDQKDILRMIDFMETRSMEKQLTIRVKNELIDKWLEWEEHPVTLKSTLGRFSVFNKLLKEYEQKLKSLPANAS